MSVGANTQVASTVGIDRCYDVAYALYTLYLALEGQAKIQSVVLGAYIEAVAAYVKSAHSGTLWHLLGYVIRPMLARCGVVAIEHVSAGKPYIALVVGLDVAHTVLYSHRGGAYDDALHVFAVVYMQSFAVAQI